MKTASICAITGIILILSMCAGTFAGTAEERESSGLLMERLGTMPLAFTENQGQWDDRVKFRADAGRATLWFTTDGIYYQFARQVSKTDYLQYDPAGMLLDRFERGPADMEHLVIKASFIDVNPDVDIVGERLMEYKCNYFIGNDPSEWRTDVPNYSSLLYKGIYPGIDLRFNGTKTGKAAYEFVAAPGADMEQIRLEYEGIDKLSLEESGQLVTETDWDAIAASSGIITDGVAASDQTASIDMTANGCTHRKSSSMTLDYSTYLASSGEDYGWDIVVDGSGNAYVTGYTKSVDFPTVDPYDDGQGGYDAFITKFNSSGNDLIYSTYLGGTSDEYCYSIAIDASGAVYVTGNTNSTNFPTVNAYQTNQDYEDGFIAKLSSAGNSLIYSTYLGGSYDDFSHDIAVDGSGSAYVTGWTWSTDFPTQNPYQTDQAFGDVFVTKFSSDGSSLLYSTYLGGDANEHAYDIALDVSGAAYVIGRTNSTDFPTENPYQTDQGDWDVFVTKLSTSGSSLVYSTYLGGGGVEFGVAIDVDETGSAYATGWTESTDYPTFNPYQTDQDRTDGFVTKLSISGGTLLYSTYLGGSNAENIWGIEVDSEGSAYVSGWTTSWDIPISSEVEHSSGEDGFVAKLNIDGNGVECGRFLGGQLDDRCYEIAVDDSGAAYVTGETDSYDFPTVNPYQTDQGDIDAFVTKLVETESHLPGDANGSGGVDIDDVVYVISYIFSGGPAPDPLASGDADCAGGIDIDDVVYLIGYIFSGGPPPGDPDDDGVLDC